MVKRVQFREWLCDVVYQEYQAGGVCIQLLLPDGDHVATATVWVPGLAPDEVAVKDYSENEGMHETLYNAGIVSAPLRFYKSGFVDIPVCNLMK